jgi:DNA-binding transcriptional LysR family regulator
MHLDLVDLRLFLLVIDAGSITHGAKSANLSLPAASERLRGMEDACGLRLLERGRRGVSPTRAGETLARHARTILRQMDVLRNDLGSYSTGLTGTIRILANTAAMTEFLPEAMAPWLAAHPRVDIDLKERASTEIVKAVSKDSAELGIISDAVRAGALQTLPFAVDQLVLVTPRGHPLSLLKRAAFADIAAYEYVGLAEGSALQDHIEEHAARASNSLRLRVRVRTFEGLCRMVAQNVGLGIISEAAARRWRQVMEIDFVRLEDSWARRRLLLCFRARSELSLATRDLVDHLSSVVWAGEKPVPDML